MNIFDVFQLLGGVALAGSYVPQIIHLHKTKDSTSQSTPFWIILVCGLLLMWVNAMHLTKVGIYSYAITQTLNVLGSVIVLIQTCAYKKKK